MCDMPLTASCDQLLMNFIHLSAIYDVLFTVMCSFSLLYIIFYQKPHRLILTVTCSIFVTVLHNVYLGFVMSYAVCSLLLLFSYPVCHSHSHICCRTV